ncbi:uncharacterized protein LOC126687480 [Mercurialis annua]|uniref:uncharacterized protein LOC126687480 n=1 Tax=Mercurialis annua TaxID=3986 RepID=UPI00216020F4|nr:uncharacterized protein LOC126687480 [Mercurialis annua]
MLRGYFWRVILEVDNKTLVDKINNGSDAGHFSNLIAAIQSIIAKDCDVRVCHVFRESNFAADHLASMSDENLIGFISHVSPPPSLGFWLIHDLYGVSYDRCV